MSERQPLTADRYVNAYDCGHRMWSSTRASVGMAWCWLCHRYVGVIVTRAKR